LADSAKRANHHPVPPKKAAKTILIRAFWVKNRCKQKKCGKNPKKISTANVLHSSGLARQPANGVEKSSKKD
jgi:hypothetical protein